MTNFLKETIDAIRLSRHTVEEVMFVGSYDGEYRINWDKFKKIGNIEYDAGYGLQEIDSELIVYFTDGSWLERVEYDGSEWWRHISPLKYSMDEEYKDFDSVESKRAMYY